MNKNKVNYFIDMGLAISFFFVFSTGIIKFPILVQRLSLSFNNFPFKQINMIHDLSGVVMGVLVIVHLVLHWTWIVFMTKKIFKRDNKTSQFLAVRAF